MLINPHSFRKKSELISLSDLDSNVLSQVGQVYIHEQNVVSNTWTINHNLGFHPDIVLFLPNGSVFRAPIIHVTLNQAVVSISPAKSGTARCS